MVHRAGTNVPLAAAPVANSLRLNRRGGFADYVMGGLHEPQESRARRGKRMRNGLWLRAVLALGLAATGLALATQSELLLERCKSEWFHLPLRQLR